jgi:N-methylhydantoinase B/oxoprolinase/acetone carboxylase alpha subunit
LRYELDERAPAPGKWRGGIGVVRENYFLAPAFFSAESERVSEIDLPHGLFGGKEGHPSCFVLNPGTEEEVRLPCKIEGRPVKEGDLFQFISPSGGGYGDPYERDPELVLEDYLDDFVSLESAEKDYGVIIDPVTDTVDSLKTEALRKLKQVKGA